MRPADTWKDYELLDATDGNRLERWGETILIRPDPQVVWKTPKQSPLWAKADAVYAASQGQYTKESWDAFEKAYKAAKEAGADFVKTSTGFSTGGAKAEDVALMRKTVGDDMGVKASGGIHTAEEAQAMIDAGASRLGTSATLAIIGK